MTTNPAQSVHTGVLLEEVIEGLAPKDGDMLIDGTLGGGGHSFEICKRYPGVRIIAIDQDDDAIARAKEKFAGTSCKIQFLHGNFRDMEGLLRDAGVREVDGVLLDLGLSSDQLETAGRGFSFLRDEPLLMTFKKNPGRAELTAEDVVNDWSEENLATIIRGYGEERFAKRIARKIVEARGVRRIKTSAELAEIVKGAVPAARGSGRIHPATKTFQAIRMAVNDELNTLTLGLRHGFDTLRPSGRLAVISFHSLEDRIVKNFYKAKASAGEAKIITKKPLVAGQDETDRNPRSRSAKLRILEKID